MRMSIERDTSTKCGPQIKILCVAAAMLWGVALTTSTAHAVEQVWGFKGTISSYVAGGGYVSFADAPVGTVVRGQFRFDDTTTDSNPSINQGDYAFNAWAIAIEGISMMHYGVSTDGDIKIDNDLPVGLDFQDKIGIENNPSVFVNFPDLGMDAATIELRLTEVAAAAPGVLASDALPATPPPALSSFTTLQELHVLGYVPSMPGLADFNVAITEFEEPGTVDLPLIPDDVIVNLDGSVTWVFTTLGISLCASGCWIDPPVSTSFTYAMTNSALFTDIVGFPSGFGTAIDVSVGGSSLGTFGPGDSLAFAGSGVTSFVVSGITPGADLSSAEAFPLELAFDSSNAEFTMTSAATAAVPALLWPAAGALAFGLAAVGSRRLERSGDHRS